MHIIKETPSRMIVRIIKKFGFLYLFLFITTFLSISSQGHLSTITQVYAGVNACGDCSKYINDQTCNSTDPNVRNGTPYCIESNVTCNGDNVPVFMVHKCEPSSPGSQTGTYRSYPQAGWSGDNCFPTRPICNPPPPAGPSDSGPCTSLQLNNNCGLTTNT